MTRIYFIVLCMIACLAVGCRRTDPEDASRLARAEAIVMEDADSAQVLLQGLDVDRFASADERARFVLTEAMVHYRLDDYAADSDSLLTIAIDRFASTNDYFRQMQALFLRANIRYRYDEYADAMNDAIWATEIANNHGDNDWKARTSEQIADLFAVTQNFQEAIPYIDRAIRYYHVSGKERNVRFALCDKVDALERLNRIDESLWLGDSVIELAKQEPVDKALLAYCYRSIFPSLYRRNQLERASIILKELEELSPLSSCENSFMAETLVRLNRASEAEPYLRRSHMLAENRVDKTNEYRALMYFHRAEGNYLLANNYADSVQSNYTEEMRNVLLQTPLAEQRNVYNEKYIQERERYSHTVITSIIIAALLVIIIISITLYFTYRLKLQRQDIVKKMEDIHTLSLRLTDALEKPSVDEKLQSRVEELFRKQWETINTLVNRYFEEPDSELTKNMIFLDFKRLLSQMTSRKNMQNLEKTVDTYMDNILTRIKAEYPKVKEDEIEFMALLFSGFSAKTICLFLGINLSNFYQKRTRLVKRISKNVSPELAELVVCRV